MKNIEGTHKDVRKLLKQLVSAGCTIERTRNSHWRVSREGSQQITIGSIGNDYRALRNAKADVRRYLGIEL